MKLRNIGVTIAFILITAFLFLFEKENVLTADTAAPVPCQEALTYRIGSIDPKFGLRAEQLKNIMKEVEKLWQTAKGRQMLQYSENGTVAIHLIYGEEQQRTEKERTLSQRIERIENQASLLKQEYRRLSQNFKNKQHDLEQSVTQYREAVETFRAFVSKWNKKGGVPRSKKDTIEEMKRRIARLEGEVRRKETNAETVRQQVNAKSKQLNKLIERQNRLISEYNKAFGEAKKFNQGHYIRQNGEERINIYQFGNHAELKTVLAHESGHALGLDHVENPESIMYPMMGEQDIFNLTLTEEDITALKQQCND